MKDTISHLIDDFHERKLPHPTQRDLKLYEIKGKAGVVIGMRRAGKTWFCYQKITELLADGIPKDQILYLNFEDDRLLGFEINNFQAVLDIYYAKYPQYRDTGCFFSLTKYNASINGKYS